MHKNGSDATANLRSHTGDHNGKVTEAGWVDSRSSGDPVPARSRWVAGGNNNDAEREPPERGARSSVRARAYALVSMLTSAPIPDRPPAGLGTHKRKRWRLRKHAGDSCQQRYHAAIQNLIKERAIPTAPGPTAGSRRVGLMSLNRVVVAIKAEMGSRLVEEAIKITPLNLALQAIIKGLPVAAQSTGSAPHIMHEVFLVLTRLSIDSSATVDKVTQSLNAIMVGNAGMQDVPMLLREDGLQPKYVPAVSAYVAETVPAPAPEQRRRPKPKPFRSEQQRTETLRSVGAAVQVEQQRSRSPIRQDDSRPARQHMQGAAPGRHSQGRGRPVQPAPQMQQREALPSPRSQEQRQQQWQYQQPQPQRQPPVCFRFNTPGGCTLS
jgi:hypothetical protein